MAEGASGLQDDRKSVRAWAMYDWANSAFITTIMAAVMPIYYHDVLGGTDDGWAFTISAAAIIVFLLSPLLGAMADHSGNKKAFLRLFTFIGAAATMCLVIPDKGDVLFASVVVVIGMIGSGSALTFYDALLNDVTSPANREKVSALGYAMGYLGGGLLLAVNLLLIQKPEWFGLANSKMGSQVSFAMVGVWWVLFSIPLFRHVKEQTRPPQGKLLTHMKDGMYRLRETLRNIGEYPELSKYLISCLFFFNGIGTVIGMATIYGKTIGIETSDLITALLITQFIGFPATLVFGALAQRFGGKRFLYGSLLAYLVIVVLGYFMKNGLHFYILAALIGLIQGGSQSTARAIYSRMIPPDRTAEFNGFLTATTRLFSLAGPLSFAMVKLITGSSRLAILAVAFFFIAGIAILTFVNTSKGEQEAARPFGGPIIPAGSAKQI
jgi:UMF1 family MFS transporter